MSATDYFENALLGLIFNADAIDFIAQNNSTSPATLFYLSLHTSNPGETGNQTTGEANYGSYARISVARSSSGLSVSDNVVTNLAQLLFPKCTSGSNTITHVGIGLSASGSGTLLFYGELTDSLNVSNGITPAFNVGELEVTLD